MSEENIIPIVKKVPTKIIKDKNFVKGKEASKILGVCQRTLLRWEENKTMETMRTPGGIRLYNVTKFMSENKITLNEPEDLQEDKEQEVPEDKKIKICYARVSSIGQKDDLIRQRDLLKEKYPNHILIEDIGSGVNLNRRGLRKIIKLAIAGNVEELVIVHKDRLTRFGYELIEDLIKDYSRGEIVVISKKEELEPEEELVKDVLTIMNVFVARMNGMRKYKKKEKKSGKKSKKVLKKELKNESNYSKNGNKNINKMRRKKEIIKKQENKSKINI